jgi:hypothetical protein
VLNVLEDGRKVYVSKRGQVHLMTRRSAEEMVEIRKRFAGSMVYTSDLGFYGDRRIFAESQTPVVAVVLTVPEPAGHPVDREAVIMGGQRAAEVGCYLDEGLRSADATNHA